MYVKGDDEVMCDGNGDYVFTYDAWVVKRLLCIVTLLQRTCDGQWQ